MEIRAKSSYIRRKDMDSVLNCLVTDSLRPGIFTDKFLKLAKEKFLFDYGLALRSPVVAFNIVLDCLSLSDGDYVALPAVSPLWAGRVLEKRHLSPLWLDVGMESGGITKESLSALTGKSVKLLYLYEACGIMPDPLLFTELGIPILEDITYSLGASSGEVQAGRIGTYTMLSLEDASSITAGGGALLYANTRRDAAPLRNAASSLLMEERMEEINSSIAASQLRDSDKFIEKRQELAKLYDESLQRSKRKTLVQVTEGNNSCFACVVVLESSIKDVRAFAKKKEVETVLAFEDSCISNGIVPEGLCPNAASLSNRALIFPQHQRIGKTSAQKICKVLASLP